MDKKIRVVMYGFIFLLQLSLALGVQAHSYEYQVLPDAIIFSIPVPSAHGFRVWQTKNPMKVIIDLEEQYIGQKGRIDIRDGALAAIRIDRGPETISTRIVLDFNYVLPDVQWIYEEGRLKVTVNKVFVRQTLHTVTQGVRYGHERRGIEAGPLIVNFLAVDLNDPLVSVKSLVALDQIYGQELVSSMAQRGEAIAAVNGLYFAADGRPLGLLAIDGRVLSEPYAMRTAIGLGPGRASIGQVGFSGTVFAPDGHSYSISGVNRPRGVDELILYSPDHGGTTRTNQHGIDLVVVDNQVQRIGYGQMAIPLDGWVVSGHGRARDFLRGISEGDTLNWEFKLEPDLISQGYDTIIGGGPRLVRDGQIYINGESEQFQRDILVGRAPRTALGLTASNTLLLVTVNGRQPGISVGMTLDELARLMLELGAVDAMNLDGGGSTTMVIRDRVLNLPSDGVERPVSNALIVITPESRR